jgi:PAS domain S-box-containing protein
VSETNQDFSNSSTAQPGLILEASDNENQSGEIETANTQTVELFGYTQKELHGMNIDALASDRYRTGRAAHRNHSTTGRAKRTQPG